MAESRNRHSDSGPFPADRPDGDGVPCVERVERIGKSVILYDAALVTDMQESFFDPAAWPVCNPVTGSGRGGAFFLRRGAVDWVLRHYRRGGQVARLTRDAFLWTGAERTRCFREWRLLAKLHAGGLPVPRPVAARFLRRGLLYRADIITSRLPGVRPLSARLSEGPLPGELWQRIGQCIGRFHAAGVFHADLNAHNVQLAASGIFLLDFDRGRLMRGHGSWSGRNLKRLHRSLEKVSAAAPDSFGQAAWSALLDGHAEGLSGASADWSA